MIRCLTSILSQESGWNDLRFERDRVVKVAMDDKKFDIHAESEKWLEPL